MSSFILNPPVPEVLSIPPYYRGPEANELAQYPLEFHAARAYDLAFNGNLDQVASNTLMSWALQCREVRRGESALAMTYWGQLFLEAYLLMNPESWNSGVFRPWARQVYRPCAMANYKEYNNRGSWGILGAILSDLVLGDDPGAHIGRLDYHIRNSYISGGVMKYEVLRTNSGMWYSYFSLAPMLRAAMLLERWVGGRHAGRLVEPLEWFFQYCLDPQSWPHRPRKGLLGWIQGKFHPHAPKLEIPTRGNWPANLYWVAGMRFGCPEWRDWGEAPPYTTSIFRKGA